jgi:hypothetical protein
VGKSLVLITLCMDIAEPTLAVAARGRIGGVVLEEGRVEAALMREIQTSFGPLLGRRREMGFRRK